MSTSVDTKFKGTDRYVAKPIEFLLNLGPWRYVMFNSFLVARKRS